MNENMKCLVVLPCYNEEENLKPLIHNIDAVLRHTIPYKVIVVNDGSQDNTKVLLKELSNQYPLIIEEHEHNQGLSEALSTGLETALTLSSDEDLIITMDSDNTHDPKYILDMITTAKDGADIVIGSRYASNGKQVNVPPFRVFLSKSVNLLIKEISRIPAEDLTSGYRCFRAHVVRKTKASFGSKLIESKGFEVSLELLAKTFLHCTTLSEVPMLLDYGKKRGKSKMKLLPTIRRYLTLLLKVNKWRKQLETNS